MPNLLPIIAKPIQIWIAFIVAVASFFCCESMSGAQQEDALPPGKYRLEVDLREQESVAQEPGLIDINQSDLDTDLDIIVR